jgi:hypothetical protein
MKNDISFLTRLGFKHVGNWTKSEKVHGSIEFNISQDLEHKGLLYAFESQGIVYYIGKTDNSLKERMTNYKSGKSKSAGSTNKFIHSKILDFLSNNIVVRIHILKNPENLDYKGIKISLTSGIELNLIQSFITDDLWNSRGSKSLKNIMVKETQDLHSKSTKELDRFLMKLGKEYYNNGILSIPKSYDKLLPESGGVKVEIFLDGNKKLFATYTKSGDNRKINGKQELKEWFSKYFKMNDLVWIQILSETQFKVFKNS